MVDDEGAREWFGLAAKRFLGPAMGKDSKVAEDKAPVHPANAKLGLSVGSRAPPRNKMAMYTITDPNLNHIRSRAHQMHATKYEPPMRGPVCQYCPWQVEK